MKSTICTVMMFLCGLLLACTENHNWTPFPAIENLNNDDQVFYDGTSIIQKSNRYQITTKIILGVKSRHDLIIIAKKVAPNKNYGALQSSIQVKEVNCKEKRLRLLSFADFDMDNKKINSGQEPTEWSDFPPKSIDEQIYKLVCK
jgi:hypothetical protein